MARIVSEVHGSIEFLMRVLQNGIPSENMTDLQIKQALFFNQVFLDGVEEIMKKSRWNLNSGNVNRLMDLYDQYTGNVWGICNQMLNRDGWRLDLNGSFEMDLACRRLLDLKFEAVGGIANGRKVVRPLRTNQVYYLGWQKYRNIYIPTIIDFRDGNSDFRDPISFIIGDETVYWKTDECIRYCLEKHGVLGATACRFTINDDGEIVKCEFNGDAAVPNSMREFFHPDCLFIPNPFVFIDDLSRIVEKECPIEVREVQEQVEIDPDLLEQDKLIEYPRDSFMDSIAFLAKATNNPKTRAIYMTIYRIGSDPTLFYVLAGAIKKGIQVHVNIELTASGEGINYFWAKYFKSIGAHVTAFESGELKVHAKVILVEQDDGRFVTQIGTGNYHTKTTRAYTDLAMNSSNQKLCKNVRELFRLFDGAEDVEFTSDLLVSKFNMRKKIIKMIEEEGQKGKQGYIFMKCNALEDSEIIEALDEAAGRGAVIDLVVRGSCCWVPYPANLNKNVRIRSFVWDKLEHSRVYAFGSHNPKLYIGSVDPVHRKISNRIEVLAAVKHTNVRQDLMNYIERYIHSNDHSWLMRVDQYGFPYYTRESP